MIATWVCQLNAAKPFRSVTTPAYKVSTNFQVETCRVPQVRFLKQVQFFGHESGSVCKLFWRTSSCASSGKCAKLDSKTVL
jgi:hypothetical protein